MLQILPLITYFYQKRAEETPATNNTRAETMAEKLMFKYAFRERCCFFPASEFYESKAQGKNKQPYFISAEDGMPYRLRPFGKPG